MMSLTFGLLTQVSGSGPLGPLVANADAGGSTIALLGLCPGELKQKKHVNDFSLTRAWILK